MSASGTDEPVKSRDAQLIYIAAPYQSALVAETDQLVTAIAALQRADQSFSFFLLPRELRNRVYRHILRGVVRAKHHVFYKTEQRMVTVAPFYEPTLLLVSRQFNQEYVEEAFIWAQGTITASMDGDRLDLCSKLPRSMRHVMLKLQHIQIRLGLHYRGFFRWSGISQAVDDQVKELVALLPALQSVSIIFHGGLDKLQDALQGSDPSLHVQDLFAARSLSLPNGDSINCHIILLLDVPLCGFNPNSMGGELYEFLTDHPTNEITYRATLTNDPLSVAGLDLRTESNQVFDYEAVVQEYEEWRQD